MPRASTSRSRSRVPASPYPPADYQEQEQDQRDDNDDDQEDREEGEDYGQLTQHGSTGTGAARNHPCSDCSKAFTTSGHLARHMKTHTGERNHKCPFPGCNTACSRQDNLQQQYVFLIFDHICHNLTTMQ
jgi:uncharacterized Zn-finger protein